MPYYIQNPALMGFQEGNANARAERGIYAEMMSNYLNNAAAAARQQAQQAQELDVYRAYAAQGLTPAGNRIGWLSGTAIADELKKKLDAIRTGSPFVEKSYVGRQSPLETGVALYNAVPVPK